ncbi:MAG TPA: peptide deformylase [Ktedonobacterales bacterium]|nr:peptide deformylase [Ktedonobacterales bacterium]
MTIRKILTMDYPVLRAKAKKVSRFDPWLERLVQDMWETMHDAPGVGLAAPQIGESVRVLVAEYTDESRNEHHKVALVNPEIVKASDEEELGTEGCLSIPGYVGDNVPRALAVSVKARDPKGKEVRVKAEGWWARILQHEIDHLNGVLYIDLIDPKDVREVTEDEVVDEGEVLERMPSGMDNKVEKHGRNDGRNGSKSGKSGKKGVSVSDDVGEAAGGSR